MPALCVLLASSKQAVQAAALALTQELCSSRHACLALVESGAASPLAAMLGSGSMGNTEVAAATLESLQALSAAGLPQTQRNWNRIVTVAAIRMMICYMKCMR